MRASVRFVRSVRDKKLFARKARHIRIFDYPLALAKRISYRADIVADMYAKYPLAEEGIPLGRLVLNTNTELGICQGVPPHP